MLSFLRLFKTNHEARFSLVVLSALGAYVFAVTTFGMFVHFVENGWDGGNLNDLVLITVALPCAFLPRVALKHADDVLVWLGFLAFVTFEWLALALHHSLAHLPPKSIYLAILAASSALLALIYWAFKVRGAARVGVLTQEKAPSVEGLVIFLSYLTAPVTDFYTHDSDGKETDAWKGLQGKVTACTETAVGVKRSIAERGYVERIRTDELAHARRGHRASIFTHTPTAENNPRYSLQGFLPG